MAIEKKSIPLNFTQGIDKKTDNKQVQFGKFLDLQNSIFDVQGQMTKRNGYEQLKTLPATDSTFLTTFNGNLTAIGNDLYAYSEGTDTWTNKGSTQPLDLKTLSLVKSATAQTQADIAVAANGLICVAFTDQVPVSGVLTAVPKYSILDSSTGQNIVPPTPLAVSPAIGKASPKCFLLGNYFIVMFTSTVTGSPRLQYIAISTANPTLVNAPVTLSTTYLPSDSVAWDGVVANNTLYVVYNGSDGGGAIRYTALNSTLVQQATEVVPGVRASTVSVCADISTPTPSIYAAFHDNTPVTGTGSVLGFNSQLDEILAPTVIITAGQYTIRNLGTAVTGGALHVYYEVANTYGYSSAVTDYVGQIDVQVPAGTVGTQSVLVRSVGMASKLFVWDGMVHFLASYDSDYQPTFFLINQFGEVISKLAYSNGGGYAHTGIPNAIVDGNTVRIPYIYKTRIQAVNKNVEDPTLPSAAGIYAQTGVNLATFEFGVSNVVPVEIGNDLNLSGGFVWSYDGVEPVEQGFHLYPDDVAGELGTGYGGLAPQQYYYVAVYEWGDNRGNIFRSAPSIPASVDLTDAVQTLTFDAEFSLGDTVLSVSDTTNLVVGQVLTDNDTPGNIAAGTYIIAIDVANSEITISQPTLGNSAAAPGDELQTVTTLVATVNVPTLRLTYKLSNPVKLTLYRWSTAQQTYYQVTSISNPILNDPSVDSIAIDDSAADTSIVGNNLLYTTGGVVENIAPPASPVMTVLKNRLFVLNAENRNEWWYSKPILPGEPVEMSDLFTYFVNPTLTGQGSTGEITAGAALDDKLISFKRNAIYYTTGDGPDAAGANGSFQEPVFITSTVGCTNQQSIVFIPQGLMFQSDKGIWLLGRDLSTQYIGADVEEFNAEVVLSAVNVPGTNQVRFTMSGGKTLVYDYYYNQWGTFTNIPAVASTLYQNLHTFVNARGQIFQETPDRYSDGSAQVLMAFTTSWLNFAGMQGFERAYFFYLLGIYLSQHKLQISIAYDYNDTPQQSTIITPDNVSSNWGDEPVWGAGDTWGGSDNIEQWRVFLQIQKCQAFRITIQELQNTEDPSPASKAGLTISGLNLVVGMKKGFPTLRASKSVG